jgi:hypothetical protein
MTTPYATLDDLAARFPRELTSAEQDQAEVLLADASFLLSVQAPGLPAAIAGGDEAIVTAAMLLTVTMVKRALLAQAAQQTVNPAADQITQAWGPYSQSIKYRSPGGNLYLYDSELEYLLALLRHDVAEAVSMRSPGL